MSSSSSQQGFFRLDPSVPPIHQTHAVCAEEPSFTGLVDILGTRKPRGRGSNVPKAWDKNMIAYSTTATTSSPQTPAESSANQTRLHFATQNAFPTPETPSNVIHDQQDLYQFVLEAPGIMTGVGSWNTSGNGFTRRPYTYVSQPFQNQLITPEESLDAAVGLLDLARSTPNHPVPQPLFDLSLAANSFPDIVHSPSASTPLLSPLQLDFDIPSFGRVNSNKENLTSMLLDPSPDIPRLRKKALSKIEHVKNALSIIHEARISPAEFLTIILDDTRQDFYDYRTAFYAENNTRRFEDLLTKMWSNEKGVCTMKAWLKPHAIDLVCDLIHDEMDSAKPALRMTTKEVTSDFISSWDINAIMEPIAEKITPVWSRILDVATETREAKDKLKTSRSRNRRVGRNIISAQVHYLRSRASAKVQIALGLVASATGTSRDMINILHTACLSMSYPSVSHIIDTLADCSIANARITAASKPTLMSYDNINISTSIFVEQVPGAMSKVQSGTFSVLYQLYNAQFKDILAAPMMLRLQNSAPLAMSDVRGPLISHQSYHSQTTINVSRILFRYIKGFSTYATRPKLQHIPRRKLPDGHKTEFHPLRATTIEEASVQGNLLNHDDIMVVQLQRAKEDLDKYMIPAINDQLTNARNRGAQALRGKDLSPWSRREVLALGFGTFHAVMNFIWMMLQVHRGSMGQIGSLDHLFALIEKVRLGAEHPDFHALLAALSQILDGLLLNAWRRECGNLDEFAASKPSSAKILEKACLIIKKYATPTEDLEPCEKERTPKAPSPKSAEEEESCPSSEEDDMPPEATPRKAAKDTIRENVVRLTRDLLYVAELVSAVANGDFGRVEDILPDLACMFRAGGSNNYSNEILHFLFNLKEVWTPDFANIMRDNMLVNVSGLPGHWMAIDLNIEHHIGYLKALFAAKGVYSNWDRLGNLSASIAHLQEIKTRVTHSMHTNYQSSSHTQRDPSELVWRIANKARDLELQDEIINRDGQRSAKAMPDLRASGREKYASASLATFNKKLDEMKKGKDIIDEEDDIPPPAFVDGHGADHDSKDEEDDIAV